METSGSDDIVFDPDVDIELDSTEISDGVVRELGSKALTGVKKPEIANGIDKHRVLRRSNIMDDMVSIFLDDPQVETVIARNRLKKSGRNNSLSLSTMMGYYSIPTIEEERKAFRQIDAGIQLVENGCDLDALTKEQKGVLRKAVISRQLMFLKNQRLVVNIAKRFYTTNGNFDIFDLINEGNIGLSKAICGFDLQKDTKFSTYATWWIKQAVSRAVADKSRLIRLPVHRHDEFKRVKTLIEQHTMELGRELSDKEIAEVTGLTIPEYELLIRQAEYTLVSLNAPVNGEEGGTELGEFLEEPDGSEEVIDDLSIKETIQTLISDAGLDNRERMIIGLRYGFKELPGGDFAAMAKDGRMVSYSDAVLMSGNATLEELSLIFGITRERVRQIEVKAKKKLGKAVFRLDLRNPFPSNKKL